MVDKLKEWIVKIVTSRLFVVWVVILCLFTFVLQHLFTLQIIKGSDYLDNYMMKIEKTIDIEGTRGNIYDRNGVLLAHNELSYTVTLEDNGTYANNKKRAELLNAEISTLIDMIEKNGDSIVNDLDLYMDPDGELSFLSEGTELAGFRRDIYGRKKVADLKYNAKLGYDESAATPEQMYEYLLNKFAVDTETYDRYRAYQIVVIRYALYLSSYQKYIAIGIAEDVSDQTVAMIREHASELQGVEVREDTKRVYDYPEYFSHILGYTGKISDSEYDSLHEQNESYTRSDVVGKAGIEQVMELQLQGKKGSETVYVNNVGKVLDEKDYQEPSAGNDVYLSLDATLQMAIYDLLEQELAGILNSKIINAKTSESSELYIPIYKVYNALIENSVISTSAMANAPDGTEQATVYRTFSDRKEAVLSEISGILQSDTVYNDLSEEMQEMVTYVVKMLQDKSVFATSSIDTSDTIYQNWKDGKISVQEYLRHAIDASWINITAFDLNEKYADTSEVYAQLMSYVTEQLKNNNAFDKIVYKYLIYNDKITGSQLCLILYEQGVLAADDAAAASLKNGSTSAFTFLKNKIQNMQITPAQLALDPCTGSCIIMNPNTGELLASVSYPGYDSNRLANNMDSAYYNSLLQDGSLPLYNNATQQTTAPGSTFKMVTASTGLTEGAIDPGTVITDTGIFERLGLKLKCWVYPRNHGSITVSQAIRDSCNYFFAETAYRLSLSGDTYQEEKGLNAIAKYATEFGLADKTNIEIPEGTPKIADEFPIDASIGQSNHSYTTAQLARYVSAIANNGTVYDLTLLNKVTDSNGNIVQSYVPQVHNQITDLSPSTWQILHSGMEMAIGEHDQFNDLQVSLAGKTGTAQENEKRPNHALFVGYAPADSPQIAIATRTAYGYGSSNACVFVDQVLKYYFKQNTEEELLNGQATNVGSSSNSFGD